MANIMNTATVNFSFAGSTEDYSETSNITTINVREENGLLIEKTAQVSTYAPGSIITYVLDIENTGTNNFTGVRITDDLSGQGYLYYVLGSAILYYNGEAQSPQIVSTDPLVFTLPPLASGESMVLSYSAQVSFSLPQSINYITNTANGIGYTTSGEVGGSGSAIIHRSEAANLSITKSSSENQVNVGESFNYYITLNNSGDTVANVNSITDSFQEYFVINTVSLKIGSGPNTTLLNTDYTIDSTNTLTVPSNSGPTITVPAASSGGNGTTVITVNGYFMQ